MQRKVEKLECECKKVEKWGKRECDFSSLVFHVSHPNCPLSLSDFAAPKVFSLSYFLGCIWSPAAPFSSLSIPLSFFLFPSSPLLTWQPSLSHQSKISLSKEEIKGLTLKFQLPSLWVSNQNFIWLFLFPYPLSWF